MGLEPLLVVVVDLRVEVALCVLVGLCDVLLGDPPLPLPMLFRTLANLLLG